MTSNSEALVLPFSAAQATIQRNDNEKTKESANFKEKIMELSISLMSLTMSYQ